jgi:signal transduction histidine kinase
MLSSNEALSRVSHELRTPLNAILGFGQLLELEELNESQRHSVEQILAGGRHLLSLIEDVVDLSRAGAGNLELSAGPVGVADELTQCAELCSPLAAEKSLSVDVEAGDQPVWALADRRRLKQVLLNLISNAIKYNRPGGSLTLRAGADGEDVVRIDVIDSGLGMTDAQLARLFVPFERLDAALHGIEGNGLGLAVCKALTEAMGGTIEVASTPGQGSTFSLRLSAAKTSSTVGQALPSRHEALAPAA